MSMEEADLVEQVYNYITKASYPPAATKNEKRVIRNKAQKFKVNDGELYYMNVKRGRGSKNVSISITLVI